MTTNFPNSAEMQGQLALDVNTMDALLKNFETGLKLLKI
jgi:hypothetical protein